MLKRLFSSKPIILCLSCKHFKDGLCLKTVSKIDIVKGQADIFAGYPVYLDARRDETLCGKSAKNFEYFNHTPIELKKKELAYDNASETFYYMLGAEIFFLFTIPIFAIVGLIPLRVTRKNMLKARDEVKIHESTLNSFDDNITNNRQ